MHAPESEPRAENVLDQQVMVAMLCSQLARETTVSVPEFTPEHEMTAQEKLAARACAKMIMQKECKLFRPKPFGGIVKRHRAAQ